MKNAFRYGKTVKRITHIAMCVALLSVCAWLAIPSPIPFTMQTFALFLIACLFPFQEALLALSSYLVLGLIGMPVFSAFQNGYTVLIGPTGGYLFGFFFILVFLFFAQKWFANKTALWLLCSGIGLVLCYAFGSIWYLLWIRLPLTTESFLSVCSVCVLPFLLPDMAKLLLAKFLALRLRSILTQT